MTDRNGAGRSANGDGKKVLNETHPDQNQALVLEAFDTLFNKRDYEGRYALAAL